MPLSQVPYATLHSLQIHQPLSKTDPFALRVGLNGDDFFFFNDTATTETSTLSLHDALPISRWAGREEQPIARGESFVPSSLSRPSRDRKSTRLNSSHEWISYAAFCLKK